MYENEFEMLFNYAKGKADDLELLFIGSDSFSTHVYKQQVETFDYAELKGISVRVLLHGKPGYAYSEKIDFEALKNTVDLAVKNAKIIESEEQEDVNNYPDVIKLPIVYNSALDSIKVEEKIALIKKMEQLSYDADKRIIHVPYVMYGDSKHYSKIANSKGLNKEDTQNFAYCYLGVLSEENGEKRMGMHFQITRDFAAFNVEELVNTAVGKSLSLLNSYPIESGSYPIVFDNDTTAALLGTFSAVFNAQNVLEGKSLLKDKINEVIASKLICLIDNGLHPDGFSTAAFDSEGYPSQETVLIEDGKLKTFLHNTHTAKMFNTKSTGNGSRSLKTSLRISPTNLYIKSGNMKREELLKMHPVIIEIVNVQGLHSGANFISGDFSLSAEGYLYKNGKRQYSLKPFTVSGNILSVLKNVEAIADDFQFNMSSIGAASVLIKELSVSG